MLKNAKGRKFENWKLASQLNMKIRTEWMKNEGQRRRGKKGRRGGECGQVYLLVHMKTTNLSREATRLAESGVEVEDIVGTFKSGSSNECRWC